MKKFIEKFKEDVDFSIATKGASIIFIMIILIMSSKHFIIISIIILLVIPLTWFYIIPLFRLGKIRARLFKEYKIEEKAQKEYRFKYMRKK